MDTEMVHMVRNSNDAHGNPLFRHWEYPVGPKFAANLYKRGAARPAAEVLAERLAELGVLGIAYGPEADDAVISAFRSKGFKVTKAK